MWGSDLQLVFACREFAHRMDRIGCLCYGQDIEVKTMSRSRWGLLGLVGCMLFGVPSGLGIAQTDPAEKPPESVSPEIVAPDPQVPDAQASESDERSVEYWVEQLSNDHYLRRESAQKRLIRSGDAAVAALESSLDDSDLETTELAIRALGEIALSQEPNDDSGAWAALDRIATRRAGSKASRAKSTLDEVNDFRSERARIAIAEAGVFIGIDEFVIQAISESHLIVQIDDSWRGDLKALDWLRWVRDIKHARVRGNAIRGEVLKRLVKMPDLKNISLLEGTIDREGLEILQTMKSIQTLEFRYIPVAESLTDEITQLPLRSSLSLIGTDLPPAAVESLRESLPGLKIEYKQGGYLGVSGGDGPLGFCQINRVLPGSAAEAAGLVAGDFITKIGDTQIRRFSDLQDKIAQHNEGDSLTVEFHRSLETKETMETTVVLGKQP